MNTEMIDQILYHSLVTVGEILVIFVFIHMIYKRRSPASIIAWILAMILFPYITVVFYFIFGLTKRKNRYKKEHIKLHSNISSNSKLNPISNILKNYGIADAAKNENFELYMDPVHSYEALIKSINDSKKSIYISTYIFNYDDVTKKIIQALVKKAEDGIDIKILIDSLGSIKLYLFSGRLKILKEAGVKIEFFMPIFHMPFRNYINLRNHRKIFIFDNIKVLSGGLNISNEYIGLDYNKDRWEDILFLVEGPSAKQYFEIFASDWFYACEEELNFTNINFSYSKNEGTYIQVVPSGPDMSKDVLFEALLCAIYSAKERIFIVTPYFIPDDSIIQALIIAKHKGLDIKLITPKDTLYSTVNIARGSYMRELEEVGVEIFLYDGAMLHAKAILFDSTSVMLGSVNLDNRSLFLNYEVATFVYSKKAIKDIEIWINKLISNSSAGTKSISKIKRVIENIMRILTPQL